MIITFAIFYALLILWKLTFLTCSNFFPRLFYYFLDIILIGTLFCLNVFVSVHNHIWVDFGRFLNWPIILLIDKFGILDHFLVCGSSTSSTPHSCRNHSPLIHNFLLFLGFAHYLLRHSRLTHNFVQLLRSFVNIWTLIICHCHHSSTFRLL